MPAAAAGVLVGFVLSFLLSSGDLAQSILSLLTGFILALLLVGVVGYGLYRQWVHDLGPAIRVLGRTLRRPGVRWNRPQSWGKRSGPPAARVFQIAVARVAAAFAFAAVFGVLTNAVLVATLVVQQVQTRRVQEQNLLLNAASNVEAVAGRNLVDTGGANRTFDLIAGVLHDPRSRGANLVLALRQIPEAMLMTTTVMEMPANGQVVSEAGETPRLVRVYPNLKPLRTELEVFLRRDRLSAFRREMAAAGADAEQYERAFKTEIADVSNQLMDTLWRLGPVAAEGNDGRPVIGLWAAAVGDSDVAELELSLRAGTYLVPFLGGVDPGPDEFGHIRDDLQYAQLPGLELRRHSLAGFNLEFANLSRASFSECDFDRVNFRGANLQGIDTFETRFSRANFWQSDLRGAEFAACDMSFSSFHDTSIIGANFRYSRLQGADFNESDLTGAIFNNADLRATAWYGSLIAGSTFRESKVGGVSFRNAKVVDGNYEVVPNAVAGVAKRQAFVVTRKPERQSREPTLSDVEHPWLRQREVWIPPPDFAAADFRPGLVGLRDWAPDGSAFEAFAVQIGVGVEALQALSWDDREQARGYLASLIGGELPAEISGWLKDIALDDARPVVLPVALRDELKGFPSISFTIDSKTLADAADVGWERARHLVGVSDFRVFDIHSDFAALRPRWTIANAYASPALDSSIRKAFSPEPLPDPADLPPAPPD